MAREKETMDMIDSEHFLKFYMELKGKTLATDARKSPFTLAVDEEQNRMIFRIPTGNWQGPHMRGVCKELQDVYNRNAQTGSWRPSEYKDLTFSASYLLPVLRHYLGHLRGCQGHAPGSNGSATSQTSDMEKDVERIEQGKAWDESDEVVQVEVKKPLNMVIPVRLSAEKWEELRKEAHDLGIGPTTLARIWILDRLRQKPKPNV